MGRDKPVKSDDVRTYPIKFYLEKSKHVDSIKKMMMSLYPEVSKTLDEWKIIDNEINSRRC